MANTNATAAVIEMTMAQWKRTPADYKTCKMGEARGRWVMRMTDKGSTMVAVSIVKEA